MSLRLLLWDPIRVNELIDVFVFAELRQEDRHLSSEAGNIGKNTFLSRKFVTCDSSSFSLVISTSVLRPGCCLHPVLL